MGKVQRKGEKGAAKAYITRTQAVKKLQCSLADFRRLCILKGIFPREPRHRKRANKGSSAPASFYYSKDIAYLAHEPVLKRLREHKAFAKKLSRALGRGEWSSAKSLEENKPVYRLDHIIKERYPTFIDALRDIDDALCLIFLFASLPSDQRVSADLVESCSRLSSEWLLYIMHSKSLRKVFLSIKGIYYQAEVIGEKVTWLVPYMFTQSIPADVDVRIMLTFLDLYKTLLGFVFFKLYTDAGLVYPPPIDLKKDETAAGVGAFRLLEVETDQESQKDPSTNGNEKKSVKVDGKILKPRDVRNTIKELANITLPPQEESLSTLTPPSTIPAPEEEFTVHPSTSDQALTPFLPTLQSLTLLPPSINTSLLAPYTIYLSLGTPRALLEFVIRSFGGKVGWPITTGSGSPFNENDESITHVIVDRPLPTDGKQRDRRRKYVQPQWVVDCINAGKILLEEAYEQGKTLPPHLSPFGEEEGAYDPLAGAEGQEESRVEQEISEEDDDEKMSEAGDAEPEVEESAPAVALKALASAPSDPALLRAAELAAERAGLDVGTFEEGLKKVARSAQRSDGKGKKEEEEEGEMNKMMMSNKKRKLYEKMKFGDRKKVELKALLEKRKEMIRKEKKKGEKMGLARR